MSLPRHRTAKAAGIAGALTMFLAALSCLEEGRGPFVSQEHRTWEKREIWSGATIALRISEIFTVGTSDPGGRSSR
jgi:hypothetical protein